MMLRCCNRLLCPNLLDFIGILGIKQHNLLAEMTFDVAADSHGLLRVDEVDGDAMLSKTARSTNTMQVCFAICTALLVHRQVEVHHDVNLIDVDTARQHICCDQNFLVTFTEAIEDSETLINGEIARQDSDRFTADFFRHLS